MFNAQCPAGYVGSCETVGNVNPRRTYFYGAAVTQQIVASVCPGGKYVPGTIPTGTGGATGQGGSGAGGSGTVSGTCADFSACCAATTNSTLKSECQSEYDVLKASGDSICAYAVSTLRAAGACK
jgi:hypothetical protein